MLRHGEEQVVQELIAKELAGIRARVTWLEFMMLCHGIPVKKLDPVVPPSSSLESIAEGDTAAVPNPEPVYEPYLEGEEGDVLRDVKVREVRDARRVYADAEDAFRAAVENLGRKG